MDIHTLLQSIGQGLYALIAAIGGWLGRAGAVIHDWFISLPLPSALKIFSNNTVNRYLFFGVIAYILLMNIWAIVLFDTDKSIAKNKHGRKRSRISEKKLFSVCFWGGAIGGMIGMYAFRHKTLKKKFSVGVPMLFLVQLLLDSFVLGFLGFWTFF